MKVAATIIACLIISITSIGFATGHFSQPKTVAAIVQPTPVPDINMLEEINRDRAIEHETPLVEDPRLDASAKEKACDMRDHSYFSHEDQMGHMSWHLFLEHGYFYSNAGENLSVGFDTNREMMIAFMQSPKHRDNILDPRYTSIGIGTCDTYLVQHFANE